SASRTLTSLTLISWSSVTLLPFLPFVTDTLRTPFSLSKDTTLARAPPFLPFLAALSAARTRLTVNSSATTAQANVRSMGAPFAPKYRGKKSQSHAGKNFREGNSAASPIQNIHSTPPPAAGSAGVEKFPGGSCKSHSSRRWFHNWAVPLW